MRKLWTFTLLLTFIVVISCDEKIIDIKSDKTKIELTTLNNEPTAESLMNSISLSFSDPANGRTSSALATSFGEIDLSFMYKYQETDNGILNYTFRIREDNNDYFENLVLSKIDDSFYGFVLRYIRDSDYPSTDQFKGTIERYNLGGDLIGTITTPQQQTFPTSNTSGKVKLISQCVKGHETTCYTNDEVTLNIDYASLTYTGYIDRTTVCTTTFGDIYAYWCVSS